MSSSSEAWSVLTKSVGPPGTPEPSEEQLDRLLASLPGGDKWCQYPPASGRGHAFETRFWMSASDASEAARSGAELVRSAQAAVGMGDWEIVRVHAASLAEREIEYYPGLEGREHGADDWSVMHRAQLPDDEPPIDAPERERLLAALGERDVIQAGSGRIVELRFWTPGEDAVDAARSAQARVVAAMVTVGRDRFTTIRLQTASVPERRREMYLGVERRLREHRRG